MGWSARFGYLIAHTRCHQYTPFNVLEHGSFSMVIYSVIILCKKHSVSKLIFVNTMWLINWCLYACSIISASVILNVGLGNGIMLQDSWKEINFQQKYFFLLLKLWLLYVRKCYTAQIYSWCRDLLHFTSCLYQWLLYVNFCPNLGLDLDHMHESGVLYHSASQTVNANMYTNRLTNRIS